MSSHGLEVYSASEAHVDGGNLEGAAQRVDPLQGAEDVGVPGAQAWRRLGGARARIVDAREHFYRDDRRPLGDAAGQGRGRPSGGDRGDVRSVITAGDAERAVEAGVDGDRGRCAARAQGCRSSGGIGRSVARLRHDLARQHRVCLGDAGVDHGHGVAAAHIAEVPDLVRADTRNTLRQKRLARHVLVDARDPRIGENPGELRSLYDHGDERDRIEANC